MRQVTRREILKTAGIGTAAIAGGGLARMQNALGAVGTDNKPNFVFILADDLGWADLACYGNPLHETPSIDRLAAQGMKFTDAYAACPVCSPTRASIMTGKYPARLNLTDWIPGHRRKKKLIGPKFLHHLPLEEVTIAEAMKKAGYATAHIGKWHLGRTGYTPDKQGFDVTFDKNPGQDADDPKAVFGFTRESIKFIRANKDRPFFLYLSHHAVHAQARALNKTLAKYKKKLAANPKKYAPWNDPAYAAMLEDMDTSIGMLMDKLDELKLSDNTWVIFFSDNGGFSRLTTNHPLRNAKGSLYEGGVRVPLIVRKPGVVEAGSKCSEIVTSTDFYPTMLELAGVPLLPKQHADGVSIASLLEQSGTLKRDTIYWHYPHYHHTSPVGALRKGDWKLLEYFEDGHLELYNLKKDIGEKVNLAEKTPKVTRRLHEDLKRWRRSVEARMPTPNPKHS